jgi:tRNA pseudouridine55 synthase
VPRSGTNAEPEALTGVLLYDKPAGVTSHDVVASVRRELGTKVGHAGTLDPFATGLLIVLLGRATRLQRYILPLPKTYRAMARLGWRSSTGDPQGELTETGRIPEKLELPTGTISQRLPATSAVRVAGERLYKRAHRGEEVETPEREVEVYRAELLRREGDRAEYEIECSAGTYVRTLIETLGDAYCERLRRVAIGPFAVAEAGREPLPVERALDFLPERELSEHEATQVGHGRSLEAGGEERGPMRMTHDGRLVAVGRVRGGELRPEVVLASQR